MKDRLRIVALVTDAYGQGGGIACYNRDLMSAMAACDTVDSIDVLPRHANDGVMTPDKIAQHPARASRADYAFAATRLVGRTCDLLFCGHINLAPVAAAISAATGTPWWLQVHGIEAWADPGSLKRRALEAAHRILFVSRYSRHRTLQWANVDWARTRIISNTVSDDFAPRPRRTDLANGALADRRPVLLTVGRLSAAERYKGHDRMIEALPEVLALYPMALYLIVGEGDDRPRLERLAEERGVSGNVVFAGAVPVGELPDYYNRADLFVMPSTGEGFGIVYLEALACGTPVLAIGKDGSADPLRDGEFGICIGDEPLGSALISALADICAAPPDRATISARARATFGPDRFRQAVRDEVERFAAGRRRVGELAKERAPR